MASMNYSLPDDLSVQLSRLGNKTDEIIPKILEAGGEVVLEKAKSNLRSVIGKGTKAESRSTGELIRSLGKTQPRQDRDGNWNIKIGFAEPRKDGNSNAKIANILEYGKHNQPPKPFMKPAKIKSKDAAIEAMKQKFYEETGGNL